MLYSGERVRADQDQTRGWSAIRALWASLLCLPKATSLPWYQVRKYFFPHTCPSVILLRFLCERGVSRKSPRLATLLFIRHVGDCIGLKNNLCNASVLRYYFTLSPNSYVFSHALAQAQGRNLSQSRDKLELESKVKINSPVELSAQC